MDIYAVRPFPAGKNLRSRSTAVPAALVQQSNSSRRNPVAITEIHAAPPAREDGRDLRFIELFNSNPYLQRIGGYTLSGSISYTF